MNATALHLPDGNPAKVWMCGKCGTLYNRQYQPVADGKGHDYTPDERDVFAAQQAEKCCDHRCEVCGEPAWSEWQTHCKKHRDEIWEKQRQDKEEAAFAKAVKLESVPEDSPMLYDPAHDKWFQSIEDAEEWYAEDWDEDEPRTRPAYLWCSTPIRFSPDFEGHLRDRMFDAMHEDADDQIDKTAWDQLNEFEKSWWEENGPASYDVDYTRCVLLPAKEVSDAAG